MTGSRNLVGRRREWVAIGSIAGAAGSRYLWFRRNYDAASRSGRPERAMEEPWEIFLIVQHSCICMQ